MQPASRKRSFLALYVDSWLFAAAWQSLEWSLSKASFMRGRWYVALAIFVLLELLLLRRTSGATPGRWALGFTRSDGKPMVATWWLERERWWTTTLGVLGLMEGVKEATRWTQGLPPPPFLGLSLSWDQTAALVTLSGSLLVLASLGVLRCRPRAALFGMLITGLSLLSWLLSWAQLDAWVDARTIAARAMQGVPLRTGELEMMRKMLPGGALFGNGVAVLWLWASQRVFCRPRAFTPVVPPPI